MKKIIFAVFILCLSFLNNTVYASDVTIRSFSPASGKPGDLITIIGFNYTKLKKVTFGNIEATVTGKTLSPTPNGFDILEVKVPTGAVTSKITIESSVNGTVTSATDFIIDTTPTPVSLKWYFIDNARSYRGPFDDVTECRTQLTAEKVATGNNTLADCVQKTPGQVAQGASNTDLVLLDPMKVDGGSGVYKLLAPIGSLEAIDTTGKTCPGNPDIANGIGCYLNIIFKIAIGLCAALAVIMLVINGIKYMTSESFTEKSELKKDMLGPIMGLFIALGAFAILNTINPALTGKDGVSVDQVGIEIINLPDAGDGEIDPGYVKKDYRYSTNSVVSPEVTSVVSKLKQGWEIDYFKVYTNERMLIALKKGSEKDTSNVIDIRSGVNGFSEIGQGRSKDKKTPKGVWKILEIRTSKNGKPVYNGAGANMGATFWLLSPMNSGERGIGMHGNKTGTLSRTFGCVRLKNSDLLALLPYVKKGISVFIGS